MTLLARILRALARLIGPEGLLLGLFLVLGAVAPVAVRIEPVLGLAAAAVAVSGAVIGWRFGRGRVVVSLLVLGGAATLPLLPHGTARSLVALLVPVDLALLGLLPDRGVATRAGMVWLAALTLQAAAVGLLLGHGLAPGSDPLAAVAVPPLATPVPAPAIAMAAALAALALRAGVAGSPPVRGLLWAAVAVLATGLGHPAGAAYLLTAAGLVLVLAALEEAHSLAYRDALTGLPSRRALDELLERTTRCYTLAMVDVDRFKPFNDRHGHDVGDQVLRMVAARLREVGGGARAFRYGGEEFTLVFRGRRLEEARPFLEDARRAVEASVFVVRGPDRPKRRPRGEARSRGRRSGWGGPSGAGGGRRRQELSVTISIGAAERVARSGSPAEVIRAADAALYRAKRGGRNRVVA